VKRDIDAPIDLKLRPIKKRERSFEYQLRDELRDEYDILFIKTKPTIEGFPDRLAIGFGGYGANVLVELKREGEDLSETQKLVHAQLAKRGMPPIVVHGPHVATAAKIIQLELRRRGSK
jgi:hypothetical protein